jgi:hypothetical protein
VTWVEEGQSSGAGDAVDQRLVRAGKSYLVGTASSQEVLFRTLEVLRDLHVPLVSIEAVSTD